MANAKVSPAPKPVSDIVEVPVGYKLVMAKVPFNGKAKRLEALIIRPFWLLAFVLVMMVYSLIYTVIILVYALVAGILLFFNWLSSFFLARRLHVGFIWAAKFLQMSFRLGTKLNNYSARRMPYFLMMTDKRPSLDMEKEPEKESGGSLA